ncbi:MAG TPA: NAD-dependent epimerase/dehydratase family protein [Acidimicrobiales bacterium]|nr:NAD-dependent epimerase/dehydratase family protein [Acidimicrobiales bacterium]
MKVAVTGGSGFIGSHVVDKLVAACHQVVVVDTRPPGRTDAVFRDVDIRDVSGLVRATSGCDAIFHLAGVSNVNDALADPVATMDVNVTGTARVWEAARRNQVGRAVFASTVWVYAAAIGEAMATEDTPLTVTGTEHVYTASKLAAELVVTSFGELYGLPYTILRYGIPFGPRMREELVIPRFVDHALSRDKLTIYGDGLQFRNYVYIEDLAEAHLPVLDERAANQIVNLEGPEPVSIRRVAEVVRELVNPRLPIEFVSSRPGDYAGREVSAAKAKQVLGWEARTPFEEGMRRYLDWWLIKAESDEAQASQA